MPFGTLSGYAPTLRLAARARPISRPSPGVAALFVKEGRAPAGVDVQAVVPMPRPGTRGAWSKLLNAICHT